MEYYHDSVDSYLRKYAADGSLKGAEVTAILTTLYGLYCGSPAEEACGPSESEI